jgi:hypothetical protein
MGRHQKKRLVAEHKIGKQGYVEGPDAGCGATECEENRGATLNISNFNIQGVPGGKVNILGGHSICHSKQKNFV